MLSLLEDRVDMADIVRSIRVSPTDRSTFQVSTKHIKCAGVCGTCDECIEDCCVDEESRIVFLQES